MKTAESLYQELLNLSDEERCKFFSIVVEDIVKTETSAYKNSSDYLTHEELFGDIKNCLFTTEEAIEYLEISKSDFLKLTKFNKIIPIKKVNKDYMFSLDDLRELKKSIKLIKS